MASCKIENPGVGSSTEPSIPVRDGLLSDELRQTKEFLRSFMADVSLSHHSRRRQGTINAIQSPSGFADGKNGFILTGVDRLSYFLNEEVEIKVEVDAKALNFLTLDAEIVGELALMPIDWRDYDVEKIQCQVVSPGETAKFQLSGSITCGNLYHFCYVRGGIMLGTTSPFIIKKSGYGY